VFDQPDPFCEFARNRGLQFTAIDVNAAPRDLAAPCDELERYTLVSLIGQGNAKPIQFLFITDQFDSRRLSMRDVLWWLSSDSWAIERVERDIRQWTALHHQAEESPAALRIFQLHVDQADALLGLLGEHDYQVLLALYQAELGESMSGPVRPPRADRRAH
jgi:hypothetical protein